jgi:hypothetical protein
LGTSSSRSNSRFAFSDASPAKLYGADFAKGCADNEKIADVLRKMPSLRRVIREREARRFEQI